MFTKKLFHKIFFLNIFLYQQLFFSTIKKYVTKLKNFNCDFSLTQIVLNSKTHIANKKEL